MISPRSFLYANRHQRSRPSTTASTCPTSSSPSSPPSSVSSSAFLSSSASDGDSYSSLSLYSYHRRPSSVSSLSSSSYQSSCKLAATATTTPSTTAPSSQPWLPKYDQSEPEITNPVNCARPIPNATMAKRSLSPPSPPTTTTGLNTRPTTPTSPVKIPTYANRQSTHRPQKRHNVERRRVRERHDANIMSPSLAALLAVTDIPRPRKSIRRSQRSDKSIIISDIIETQQVSEKELSWNLSRSPLEMLLSPPEEPLDDDESMSDCNIGSALSTRTLSMDSIPSLGHSFSTDPLPSLESPRSPSPLRRTKCSPMRRSLEPAISPAGDADDHPLAVGDLDVDEMDFRVFEPPEVKTPKSYLFKPFKSAFKSNLTASLRALRSAAKSFSVINFPSIPPEDFLTRSILTIDPNVPYTDERRPPVSEDIPSAAVRRYLNPTTNARIETRPTKVAAGTFAASIQMRTYKIQRSRPAHLSARCPYPSTSLHSSPAPQQEQPQPPVPSAPVMRQRETRENPDFIRIAVMEMAMRKKGKLDDSRPGRARWALPPRKMSTKPYEIGSNGVPVRWIPTTC